MGLVLVTGSGSCLLAQLPPAPVPLFWNVGSNLTPIGSGGLTKMIWMARVNTGDIDEDGIADSWELSHLPVEPNWNNLVAFAPGQDSAVLYDLKDAAYDAAAIKAHSQALGSVPIIDANKRRGAEPPMATSMSMPVMISARVGARLQSRARVATRRLAWSMAQRQRTKAPFMP